jgi:hypothetical protein
MRTAGKKVKEMMEEGSNISAMNCLREEWCPIYMCGSSPSKYCYNALNMEFITVGENQYIFKYISRSM